MAKKQKFPAWVIGPALFVALIAAAAFWYVNRPVPMPDLPTPPLKNLAAEDGVELGMLVDLKRLGSEPYQRILTSQYSMITSDGQIHWDKLRPAPATYAFGPMDTVVAFAQAHDMPVQAHHLLWGEDDSLPAWLKNGNYTKQQLLNILHDHVDTVVGRYKGKVAEWTVVNEAFTRDAHIYGLDNWWGEHLGGGTEYIDNAFRWAHEADPSAKLILNDFYNETETGISDVEYAYIKAAKVRGVPIDGMGIQMHIDASRPPDRSAMIKNMRRFGAIGVPVYITEFDVNSSTVKGSAAYKAQLEARITGDVVAACVESKACASFTVFGMTDKDTFWTWLTRAKLRSYLMTSNYQPQQSFYAFRDAWTAP